MSQHAKAYRFRLTILTVDIASKALSMRPLNLVRLPFSNPRASLLAVIILQTALNNASPHLCSNERYGSPASESCLEAVSKIPQDRTLRYFVEQQLRTAPPQADWPGFQDSRPVGSKASVMQLPKLWSQGDAALNRFTILSPSSAMAFVYTSHLSNALTYFLLKERATSQF